MWRRAKPASARRRPLVRAARSSCVARVTVRWQGESLGRWTPCGEACVTGDTSSLQRGRGNPRPQSRTTWTAAAPQVYQSLQRDRTSSARGDGASSVRAAALRTLWRRSTWARTLDRHLPAQEVRTNAAPHGLLPLVPHRGRAECVHAQASIRSILIAQPSCRDKGEGRQCQHSAGRRVSKSLPSVHKRISVQISE
jgi:hypothetical protein